ncbi:hypothetical protein RAL92_21900 [Metapseudomonas otitidis]|uniref:hypothetical protein n=1 Tax=Metapseudomonas otitidis TaxID=319939 RepID=UPI0032170BA2
MSDVQPLIGIASVQFSISMPDLYEWIDDTKYLTAAWRDIARYVGVNPDALTGLWDLYFERTKVGEGDLHAFLGHDEMHDVLIFDLYREITDQMDIIEVTARVARARMNGLRKLLREAFDQSSCQLGYRETCSDFGVVCALDPGSYPKVIEENRYAQQLRIWPGKPA